MIVFSSSPHDTLQPQDASATFDELIKLAVTEEDKEQWISLACYYFALQALSFLHHHNDDSSSSPSGLNTSDSKLPLDKEKEKEKEQGKETEKEKEQGDALCTKLQQRTRLYTTDFKHVVSLLDDELAREDNAERKQLIPSNILHLLEHYRGLLHHSLQEKEINVRIISP